MYRSILSVAIFMCASAFLSAQWLSYPTPGIPRTSDGKPNLTAPAPKMPDGKPDLSGYWVVQRAGDRPGRPIYDISALVEGGVMPLRPEQAALVAKRAPFDSTLRTTEPKPNCLPLGVILDSFDGPNKFIQTPTELIALKEYNKMYREIFLDGRPLPEIVQPGWDGYSTGHWQADTLVVQTIGSNDRNWLDIHGHPLSEAAKITERYRRPDFGHMTVQFVVDDPMFYAKPFTININKILRADTEILEFICAENEKDLSRIQKANDAGKNK